MKKYWEFWLDERERSVRLTYVVLVQFAVIFILTYSLFKITTAPKPVYVVPISSGPEVVYPDKYTENVVKDFVERYLNLLYTYTPKNIKKNYNVLVKYVAPELYQEAEYDIMQNEQTAINQELSSVIYFNSVKSKKIKEGKWLVVVSATIKQFFAGNTPIVKNVTLNVYVESMSATKNNPYGLYIYSLTTGGKQQ